MVATIRLTVLTGPHKGTRYCLRGPRSCMVGRAAECQVRFCGTERDLRISRRHCQLYCDPPQLRVQDIDSSNGTYINGQRVSEMDEECWLFHNDAQVGVAQDGDVITLGGTSLRVNVLDCAEVFDQLGGEPAAVKQDCPIEC
jgi:eukaryotic-like serine/threonine-protein kinase